nr:MAG TPA: hypothetical protein [Caudoviricetes sp.]
MTDLTSRPSQPNSLASFPTVSSLSPSPEGHCPSGTTTFSPNAQPKATYAVTDDEFTCPSDEFPPPYPVHEEAPLAVAPSAEQRQTNVVKALQGKMADFISGSSQRHYRTIVRELSDRQIPLNLLSDESKAKGLAQMLEEDVCSLSELVILGQFAKAIDDSDTRAAEFLRDTAGYKPQTDVTVEHKTQGLASLTDTQLLTLLQALNPEQGALPEEVSNE